jgi:hypothetical protein
VLKVLKMPHWELEPFPKKKSICRSLELLNALESTWEVNKLLQTFPKFWVWRTYQET